MSSFLIRMGAGNGKSVIAMTRRLRQFPFGSVAVTDAAAFDEFGSDMKTLVKTTNPALISYLDALLRGEGIAVVILDANASIIEGSIGILPRRVAVSDDDYDRAVGLLAAAGLEDELCEPEKPAQSGFLGLFGSGR